MTYAICKVMEKDNNLVVHIPKNSRISKCIIDKLNESDLKKIEGGNYSITLDDVYYPCLTMEEFNPNYHNLINLEKDTKFVFYTPGEYNLYLKAEIGEDYGSFLNIKTL